MKIILDLCGGTGAWSKPYKDAGYDVRVITLPDNDVLTYKPPKNVYGILAAPPCTMFSFARTNAKKPRDLMGAMEIVYSCFKIIWGCQYNTSTTAKRTNLKFWALENPYYGLLQKFIGLPVYEFNPYDFGEPYRKRTALWGNFNINLIKNPVVCRAPKFDYLESKNIVPSKYGKLSRQIRRAITPPGFAKAFFEANR